MIWIMNHREHLNQRTTEASPRMPTTAVAIKQHWMICLQNFTFKYLDFFLIYIVRVRKTEIKNPHSNPNNTKTDQIQGEIKTSRNKWKLMNKNKGLWMNTCLSSPTLIILNHFGYSASVEQIKQSKKIVSWYRLFSKLIFIQTLTFTYLKTGLC